MELWKEKEIGKLLRLKFDDPERLASPLNERLMELLDEQLAEIVAMNKKGIYALPN